VLIDICDVMAGTHDNRLQVQHLKKLIQSFSVASNVRGHLSAFPRLRRFRAFSEIDFYAPAVPCSGPASAFAHWRNCGRFEKNWGVVSVMFATNPSPKCPLATPRFPRATP